MVFCCMSCPNYVHHWGYEPTSTLISYRLPACLPLPALPGLVSQVVPGQSIVEVKPQGVSKGKMVERILHELTPDFVLCIGNDRSGARAGMSGRLVWGVLTFRVGVRHGDWR